VSGIDSSMVIVNVIYSTSAWVLKCLLRVNASGVTQIT